VDDCHFSDLVCPARVRLLRLTLREYSLCHEALLLSQRSAFLVNSANFPNLSLDEQVRSLKTAVLICSQTWSEIHRPQRWMKVWSWLTRKECYPLAIAEFQNYLAAGRSLPRAPTSFACEVLYGKEDEKGRRLGSPDLAQFYNFAVDNPRKVRTTEPWDAPYALTGTLYLAQLELEGRARIENDAEAEERLSYEKIQREVAEDEASGRVPKAKDQPTNLPTGLASLPPDLSD
jgi:hypothetical protein